MQNELVSIITPSYNTEKFISKTIDSVLNQTYKKWEMIIVDDCSTDDTDQVIENYLADSRIRYIKNSSNMGAAYSRNVALKIAKGRWIAFLDSDDIWYPEKLKQQISFMKKRGCAFSYTKYEQIDENDCTKGIIVSGPRKITKMGMYNYCWPGCLTVMYDKSVVGIVQIKNIKKNNDYAMWLKVIEKTDCYLYDKVLSQYRIRSGSVSNHGYLKLIRWHYKLFRDSEKLGVLVSLFYTIRNLLFGCLKKILYVKRI